MDEYKIVHVRCDSGRTRTCDLLIRSQLLYPAELRSHGPVAKLHIASHTSLPILALLHLPLIPTPQHT